MGHLPFASRQVWGSLGWGQELTKRGLKFKLRHYPFRGVVDKYRYSCRVRAYRRSDRIAILTEQLMDIQPIRTDEDHRTALAVIDACWGAPEGTEEGDKLDVLVALVEAYEAKRWPIEITERFDPIDVLHFAVEEFGHTQ